MSAQGHIQVGMTKSKYGPKCDPGFVMRVENGLLLEA